MSHISQGNLQSVAFAVRAFGAYVYQDEPLKVLKLMRTAYLAHPHVDVDTLVANVGIVLDDSVMYATRLWHDNMFSHNEVKHFLICGYHGKKRVAEMFEQSVVCSYFGIEKPESVVSQGLAAHTGAQASWVAKQMKEKCSKGALLVAPAFHLPRKYLTVLEALRREYGAQDFAPIPVIPLVCPRDVEEKSLLDVALEKEHGESDNKGDHRTISELDAVHGEHARIIAYQAPKADGSPGDCPPRDVHEVDGARVPPPHLIRSTKRPKRPLFRRGLFLYFQYDH